MRSELIKEVWKPIPNYEGLYEASNFGRIKSFGRFIKCRSNSNRFLKGRVIKPGKHPRGYLHVILCKEGNLKKCFIHRLVYESFVEEIPEGMQVNHIDENKENNFVFVNPDGSVNLQKSNLNLMTSRENTNWGTANQRRSEKLSRPVYQYTLDYVLVRVWPSTKECGRNGFSQSNVSDCCLGKRKTHKGFLWSYVPL